MLILVSTLPAFSQNNLSQASFDSLSLVFNRSLVGSELKMDSAEIQPFEQRLNELTSHAEQEADLELLANCRFMKLVLLNAVDTKDIYENLVIAQEAYQLRDKLSETYYRPLMGLLSRLYNKTQRFEEQLNIELEYCNFQQSKNPEYICLNLGSVYLVLKQYKNALYYYKLEKDYAEKKNDYFEMASMCNNIGSLYADIGETELAQAEFKQALELLKTDPEKLYPPNPAYIFHFRNFVNWNLLQTEDKEENEEKKYLLAQALIKTGNTSGEDYWELKGYTQIAIYHYRKLEYDKTLEWANKAIVFAKNNALLLRVPELITLKAKASLAKGNKQEADQLFTQAEELTDSLKKVESNFQATVAAARYQSREKEKELSAAKEQTLNAEVKTEEEKLRKKGFAALFILSLAVLGLVLLLLRQSRKNRKLIAGKNQALVISLGQKEELLKEVHHRVKNNLQVISSLLDLQGMRITDDKAKAALEEGKSRVQSIALLHHQLYQHEDMAKVKLNVFTRELATQVMGVFNKPGQEVELNINIPETEIDIDTAVPLGLILNELLTNSFKYGTQKPHPTLSKGEGFADAQTQPLVIEISFQNTPLQGAGGLLTYRDNGPGLPKDFDLGKASSLGLRLVSQLSKQIKGSSQYQYNKGAEFRITFRTK